MHQKYRKREKMRWMLSLCLLSRLSVNFFRENKTFYFLINLNFDFQIWSGNRPTIFETLGNNRLNWRRRRLQSQSYCQGRPTYPVLYLWFNRELFLISAPPRPHQLSEEMKEYTYSYVRRVKLAHLSGEYIHSFCLYYLIYDLNTCKIIF